MSVQILRRCTVACAALALTAPLILGGTASAVVTRTSGTGQYVDVGWTEYDPDDLLGLPGNVHVGYLFVESGPYGTYFYGNVTDFDCDEGEVPWGGHGVVVEVVDEAAEVIAAATEDAIDEVVDSGGATIDADVVVDNVQSELGTEIPETIEDEFEEIPACDYLQDRFLDGQGTATVTVDVKQQTARITGRLTVTNGGHGEPGTVLATPPIDVTITGGEWERYEYSYSSKGATYSFSDWQKGTRLYGGTVTGGIGAMGFADDSDDVSYGGFASYRYRTVERVR